MRRFTILAVLLCFVVGIAQADTVYKRKIGDEDLHLWDGDLNVKTFEGRTSVGKRISVTDVGGSGPYYIDTGIRTNYHADLDGDTMIQVEEATDEDTIRIDIEGGEEIAIVADSMTFNAGASDPVLDWATSGQLALTTGTFRIDNALVLTQTDGNEKVDSDADGDVDLHATTTIDLNIGGSEIANISSTELYAYAATVRYKADAGVASATALDLPAAGNAFSITGTTNITSIAAADTISGRFVILTFEGILTFTDGGNLKLAGDMTTSGDDTIALISDGTSWFEVSRSVN